MKENKKLKFSFLIVAMISLSLLLAMIPTTFNFIITTNSRGVMTSYMHEDKKLIEDDFYKSKAFDEALIRPLLYWTSTSVIDENDNRNYEKDYLENKNLYFNIYENVALNAFITFLSLRDMNIIKQEDLNDLSQAIFTQIQSIAISSI